MTREEPVRLTKENNNGTITEEKSGDSDEVDMLTANIKKGLRSHRNGSLSRDSFGKERVLESRVDSQNMMGKTTDGEDDDDSMERPYRDSDANEKSATSLYK